MLQSFCRQLKILPWLRMCFVFTSQLFAPFGFFSCLKTLDFDFLKSIDGCFTDSVLVTVSLVYALAALFYDGYWRKGYFRRSLELTLEDSKIINISICEGDLLTNEGYRVIPVNDFFDAIVDNNIISKDSLHGKVLTRFWQSNDSYHREWSEEVKSKLRGKYSPEPVARSAGNRLRYPIGASVALEKDGNQFIFVALSRTMDGNVTKATFTDYMNAITKCLEEARRCCSGQPVAFPLIGSGLSRTKLSPEILLQLLLLSIAIESRNDLVSYNFQIVLTAECMSRINLYRVREFWRQIN